MFESTRKHFSPVKYIQKIHKERNFPKHFSASWFFTAKTLWSATTSWSRSFLKTDKNEVFMRPSRLTKLSLFDDFLKQVRENNMRRNFLAVANGYLSPYWVPTKSLLFWGQPGKQINCFCWHLRFQLFFCPFSTNFCLKFWSLSCCSLLHLSTYWSGLFGFLGRVVLFLKNYRNWYFKSWKDIPFLKSTSSNGSSRRGPDCSKYLPFLVSISFFNRTMPSD